MYVIRKAQEHHENVELHLYRKVVEVASWEKYFSMLGNEKINFPTLEKREKRENTRIYHMTLTRP